MVSRKTNSHDDATQAALREVLSQYDGYSDGAEHPVPSVDKNAYQRECDELNALWADLGAVSDDPDILAYGVSAPKRPLRKWPYAVAASLLLSVAVYWFVDQQSPQQAGESSQRFITRIGEQKIIALTDGSTIELNTNSEILVSLSDSQRKVELRRGEAYFDVTPDAGRPFSVDLGANYVTVLGTAFNIHRQSRGIRLVVTEGEIAVHPTPDLADSAQRVTRSEHQSIYPGNIALKITAGQQVDYDLGMENYHVVSVQNAKGLVAWRSGILKFKSVPLQTLVNELSRYSPREIKLLSSDLSEFNVSAAVDIQHIDRVLKQLERELPVIIERDSREIRILKKQGG